MQLIKPVFLSIVIALFASACGQKGPLYLPQSDQAPTQDQDDQSEQSQEKDDGKNDAEKA